MTAPGHRKLWARLALAGYVILCGLWLLHLDYAAKISTNVLDLIPNDERSPELGLVRHRRHGTGAGNGDRWGGLRRRGVAISVSVSMARWPLVS